MKSFLKKIWNILMWLRMTAFQLYSFAVIGGCSILINIFAFLNCLYHGEWLFAMYGLIFIG